MSKRDRGAPVAKPDRIVALDVLRGFAILGILMVNILSFAMVDAAYMNPAANGRLGGLETWLMAFTHLFFDQKFMTLFTMLFGAGIVLMTTRAEATGRPAIRIHYRRQFWLLIIGLAHAYLLWSGDILTLYAVTAFWTVWLRKLSPRWLIVLGVLIVSVASLISMAGQLSIPLWTPEDVATLEADWAPSQEALNEDIEAMRGGWLTQMPYRVESTLGFHLVVFLVWGIWRAGGLFLIGMALFKLGVITGERTRKFYARMAAIGLGVGLPVVLYGLKYNLDADFDVTVSMFGGGQFNYWASIPVSLGYLGLVMLAVKSNWLPALQARLAACGQMALTNYLTQTIICTFIFYGHGLGLYETMSRAEQLVVVGLVWTAQLIWSPWWMARYRFGPFEWAWRSLTYGKVQPFPSR